MMRFSMRKFLLVFLLVYICGTLWVVYLIFVAKKTPSESFNKTGKYIVAENSNIGITKNNKEETFHRIVNIWGKAAIAEYLWFHIFEGELSQVPGYLLYKGVMNIQGIKISYMTGPHLTPLTSDTGVKDLILVINGRNQLKVETSKSWLDALVNKDRFYQLQNLGLIVLGNELCENDWLWYYLDNYPSLIKFVFIVYDINRSGSRPVFQWPLGVAAYRKFPLIAKNNVNIKNKRQYKCNFLGTVYANSSRVSLTKLLEKNTNYNCYVKVRYTWAEKESKESMSLYHDVLQNSDLTLCPVGINSESYRIYEALSYGSVPVLEDVMTPGRCGKDTNQRNTPYALLKQYKAPVIYIKNWNELPKLLEKEASLTHRDIIRRRKEMLDWYELFRYKVRENVLAVTLSNFK